MKTQKLESTYMLLVRSEETERSISESVVYLLLIVSAAFSIWQAAHCRVTVPASLGGTVAQAITQSANNV